MEELRAVAVATDARATAGLTVAERDALFSALKRVRANLQDPSLAAPALRRAGGFDGR
jgi:hypothetical protein